MRGSELKMPPDADSLFKHGILHSVLEGLFGIRETQTEYGQDDEQTYAETDKGCESQRSQ